MPITILANPDQKAKYPRIYWPGELVSAGYVGKLQVFEGSFAIVIPKPGAATKDIAKTLELLAQDFRYRADSEK